MRWALQRRPPVPRSHALTSPRAVPQGDWVYGKRHGKGAYFFGDGGRYDVSEMRARSGGRVAMRPCEGSPRRRSRAFSRPFRGHGCMGSPSLTRGGGARVCGAQGDWVDDKICGHGRCVYANGNTYEGDWMDGRIEGKGTLECVGRRGGVGGGLRGSDVCGLCVCMRAGMPTATSTRVTGRTARWTGRAPTCAWLQWVEDKLGRNARLKCSVHARCWLRANLR